MNCNMLFGVKCHQFNMAKYFNQIIIKTNVGQQMCILSSQKLCILAIDILKPKTSG